MKADNPGRSYEEDEDPSEVFARSDAAEKGLTAPPDDERSSSRRGERLRHGMARVLRFALAVIESSH
ncbi:MAG TPA: hypothetical protein VGN41_15240 [Streptosporangiaceae bacterium]